jgi:hypothetical protein
MTVKKLSINKKTKTNKTRTVQSCTITKQVTVFGENGTEGVTVKFTIWITNLPLLHFR